MAREYYFDYVSIPGVYKNSTVEAENVGFTFLRTVTTVLRSYGVKIRLSEQYKEFLYLGNKFRGFIAIAGEDGIIMSDENDRIDISLSQDNKLCVDFVFDPLVKENSNDEIIADIKKALIEHKILEPDATTHTSGKIGRSEMEATPYKSTGCYIATAVYGSYDCPEVWTLRRFRDYSLAQSWYGRAFIKVYYTISPTLVKLLGNRQWFQQFWEKRLNNLVKQLNAAGFDNTPYQDTEN